PLQYARLVREAQRARPVVAHVRRGAGLGLAILSRRNERRVVGPHVVAGVPPWAYLVSQHARQERFLARGAERRLPVVGVHDAARRDALLVAAVAGGHARREVGVDRAGARAREVREAGLAVQAARSPEAVGR